MKENVFYFINELETTVELKDDKSFAPVQLLKLGKWVAHKKGEFEITEEIVEKFVENFNLSKSEIMFDYDHASSRAEGEETKAAGWAVKLLNKGKEGLWAIPNWTKRAQKYIEDKEFKYISPEFTLNAIDKETGEGMGPMIKAIGVTNRPFVEGMEAIALSEKVSVAYQKFLLSEKSMDEKRNEVVSSFREIYKNPFAVSPVREHSFYVREIFDSFLIAEDSGYPATKLYKVNYERKGEGFEFGKLREVEIEYKEKVEEPGNEGNEMELKKVSEIMGLSESATEEEVVNRLKEMSNKETFQLSEFKKNKSDLVEATVQLSKVKEENTKLLGENASLLSEKEKVEKEILVNKCDSVISCAIKEGKILPKSKDVWKKQYLRDPEGTGSLIDTMEKVIDLSEKNAEGNVGGSIQLSELDIKIAKDLNLTQEEFLKGKIAEA